MRACVPVRQRSGEADAYEAGVQRGVREAPARARAASPGPKAAQGTTAALQTGSSGG